VSAPAGSRQKFCTQTRRSSATLGTGTWRSHSGAAAARAFSAARNASTAQPNRLRARMAPSTCVLSASQAAALARRA
jgi:hypothetical protein